VNFYQRNFRQRAREQLTAAGAVWDILRRPGCVSYRKGLSLKARALVAYDRALSGRTFR